MIPPFPPRITLRTFMCKAQPIMHQMKQTVSHLLTSAVQTAGRGKSCPFLQHQRRLKLCSDTDNWESSPPSPPTQFTSTTKGPLKALEPKHQAPILLLTV